MPPSYTENELRRMRENAIASAREMQRRAAIKGGEPDPEPPRQPREQPKPQPEERRCEQPKAPHAPPPPMRATRPPAKIGFPSLPQDDDTLLILALVIILSSDGGDMLLIFALIYILL